MTQVSKKNQTTVDTEKLQAYLNAMGMGNNLNQNEFQQFVEIAQSFGLNPFKREIYASKYGDQFSVIVGFETYIKRAERSGLLSGWHVETIGSIDWSNINNSSLVARITIHRKDFDHPFIHDVHFIEYVGRKRDGSLTKFWKEKPITMTKKVAMAQGFRLCFSDELGGMPYTREELNTMDVDHVVVDSNVNENVDFNTQHILNLALSNIECSKSIGELVEIWKSNEVFQGDPKFKQAMATRKKQINDETLAENELINDRTNKLLSMIQNAVTVDEIIELTMNETNEQVLEFAKNQIEKLAQ